MEHGIVVDSEKFKSIELSLEEETKKVEEILDNIVNIMKVVDGNNNVWKGKTATKAYEKFLLFSKNFPEINNQLNNNNQYLKYVIENYVNAENKINASINNSSSNFTVL